MYGSGLDIQDSLPAIGRFPTRNFHDKCKGIAFVHQP